MKDEWQEIAMEAAGEWDSSVLAKVQCRLHVDDKAELRDIILAAIARSHAAQPQPSKASQWCSCNDPEYQHRTHEHDQPPTKATDDKQEKWRVEDHSDEKAACFCASRHGFSSSSLESIRENARHPQRELTAALPAEGAI
jgi:hypothetical protein